MVTADMEAAAKAHATNFSSARRFRPTCAAAWAKSRRWSGCCRCATTSRCMIWNVKSHRSETDVEAQRNWRVQGELQPDLHTMRWVVVTWRCMNMRRRSTSFGWRRERDKMARNSLRARNCAWETLRTSDAGSAAQRRWRLGQKTAQGTITLKYLLPAITSLRTRAFAAPRRTAVLGSADQLLSE